MTVRRLESSIVSICRRVRLRRGLHLPLVVVVAAASIALFAPVAAAFSGIREGRPGTWTVFKIHGSHFDQCSSIEITVPPPLDSPYWYPYYSCFNAWVTARGPLVRRSPALAGRQQVRAAYQLLRLESGRWIVQASAQHVGYLAADQYTLQMPRVDFLPTNGMYLRVQVAVTWNNIYGRTVGGRGADYVHRNDYVCSTRFSCTIGGGWVSLRAPGA